MTGNIYDHLLRPRRLSDDIYRLGLRRAELSASLLPAAVTYDTDRVQVTPDDRVASIMAEVADIDARIEELKREKAETIMQISQEIDQLEDSRERVVLDAYYMGHQSMTEISEYLHYSLPHTYRLRDSGIENMRKMRKMRIGPVI